MTIFLSRFNFIRAILFMWVVALSTTPAHARDKAVTPTPNPEDLIGKEVIGNNYPDGWTRGDWARYGKDQNYVLLTKGKFYAFVLEKTESTGRPLSSKITDAVLLKGSPQKGGGHDMSTDCRGPTVPADADVVARQQLLIAEVVYKKCARYSNNILSAWLLDLKRNTITPWPTHGMRCGNTYLDSGEIQACKFIPREW